MTKLKVRGLKWKRLKVRGSILHFCLNVTTYFENLTIELYVFYANNMSNFVSIGYYLLYDL